MMKTMKARLGVALLLGALLAGCAPALSARMSTVPSTAPVEPDPAAATVVFLRPGGGGANAIVDEDGKALGEMPTPSKLVVKIPPGKHTFYKTLLNDPSAGDYALHAGAKTVCHALTGDFEAGKLYFVEASVFRLYAVKPGDGRLAEWAAAPLTEIDPARAGSTSLAGDPHWGECKDGAREHAAGYEDAKSVITPADGFAHWP